MTKIREQGIRANRINSHLEKQLTEVGGWIRSSTAASRRASISACSSRKRSRADIPVEVGFTSTKRGQFRNDDRPTKVRWLVSVRVISSLKQLKHTNSR